MENDIFNPEVSVVVKGIRGKTIVIYGTNGTGKTSNMAKANKPLFLAVENGLNALNGVKYVRIKSWSDFKKAVNQLTGANREKAQAVYETVIVDSLDGLDTYAAKFVSGIYGVQRLRDGNDGYGLWQEYSQEIETQVNLLVNSGYTVVFLAHEDERDLADIMTGGEGTMFAPKGDKRLVKPILNLADIVAFAQVQPDAEDGTPVDSTLWLRGNQHFLAKTRFKYMDRSIPSWNFEKLEEAISVGIEREEQMSGMKGISFEESEKREENKKTEKIDLRDLIERIGLMVKDMVTKEGSQDSYKKILMKVLNNADFKCNAATEEQREQLELVYTALVDAGYSYGKKD